MKLLKYVAFILILTMSFSMLVACDNNSETPTGSANNTPTSAQGDLPTEPDAEAPTEENADTPESPLSKYSQLLQNVLTSEEYNNLISYAHNTNPYILETGEFEPHPYAFLEDEGFDVEAIKKGNDLCHTFSYVLTDDPTSLYMYTRVDCGEYYENFLLKYQLTEQEMRDYNLTHNGKGNVFYYVQSVFMNREIAATRDPEVVGTSKMSKHSFEELTSSMNGRFGMETKTSNIIFINPNKDTREFTLILYPRNTNPYGLSCTSSIVNLTCYSLYSLSSEVCSKPIAYNEFVVLDKTTSNSILYFTNDAVFKHLNSSNLNNELN